MLHKKITQLSPGVFYVILMTSGKNDQNHRARISTRSSFTNSNDQMKKDKEEALLKKREEAERKVQILQLDTTM